MNNATLLQRRRKSIRISKEETLLMLRAYRAHPTRWNDVIDDIKQNIDRLPQPVRELYNSATIKQLKDRLSVKLAKVMSTRNIEDQDLRGEVESIRENERRLVRNAPQAGEPMQQNRRQQAPAADQENNADHGDRDRQVDGDQAAPAGRAERRDAAAAALSDNDSEGDEQEPPRRRRRLAELVRENHEMYNKFMKKKLPKLMREFGISSSDSD